MENSNPPKDTSFNVTHELYPVKLMTPKLNAALSKAQGEFTAPPKNKTAKVMMKAGGSYEFSYADLTGIVEMAKSIMAKHGLSHSGTTTFNANGRMIITVVVRHESGEQIEASLPLPIPDRPQELGSLMTYYRRYLLCLVLGIVSDDDDDANLAEGNKATIGDKKKKAATGSPAAKGPAPAANAQPEKPREPGKLSDAQIKRLYAIAKTKAWTEPQLKEALKMASEGELTSFRDLSKEQYDWLCERVGKMDYDAFVHEWVADQEPPGSP